MTWSVRDVDMLSSNQIAEAVAILSLSMATVCPPLAGWMTIENDDPVVIVNELPAEVIKTKASHDQHDDKLTHEHPAHTSWCETSRLLRELENDQSE